MRLAVFGLTVSSSWGNGHATLWRGLIAALGRLGHHVTFFERDVPYYAQNRDLRDLGDAGRLRLYTDWQDVADEARRCAESSDVVIVTSFCPDALPAASMLRDSRRPLRCFYDLDTPVTLDRLASGETVPYLGPEGLALYDLVLSYTGGAALDALRTRLGAVRAEPLYGWADPDAYRPVPAQPRYRADLSYLGTYAADRQAALAAMFVGAARARPEARFVIGGAQYPADFPWTPNIWFVRHLPPAKHPAFFCSSRLTLNVTRAAMARMGWCPSGRLFEAASCGTPILTDSWEGLDSFFEPGGEILVAHGTDDVLAALDLPSDTLASIARRARDRVLGQHTASHRAASLVRLLASTQARAAA